MTKQLRQYIRAGDGARMVEAEPGWFVSSQYTSSRVAHNDNVPRVALTELASLEHTMAESSKNLSSEFVGAELDRIFKSERTLISTIKDATFVNGKRRVRSGPICNLAISTTRSRFVFIPRQREEPLDSWTLPTDDTWVLPLSGRRFRTCAPSPCDLVQSGVNDGVSLSKVRGPWTFYPETGGEETVLVWQDAVARWNTTDLAEPQSYRAIGACYHAERPETDHPEHTLWPRGSRNASPTRTKDKKQLVAFWQYRELNKSFDPLQSNFMQADNDNAVYDDDERERGEATTQQPKRRLEAELENRPNDTELIERYSAPTVKYDTRQVGLITGPQLSDCGYGMFPTSPLIREMTVPVSGNVWCMGFHKDQILECENAARISLARHGIRSTPKNINAYVDEITKPELLNISDVAKHRTWTLYEFGGLRFARFRTKKHYLGQLTHYRDKHGQWHRAKEDEYGTPYGPESMGSDDKNWEPLYPKDKRGIVSLSPAEKAKQRANKAKPLPCPMTADEALESWLKTNGKPANENVGLPYDVDSADELHFGYAFGSKYTETTECYEPFNGAMERKETLAPLNARLSPLARRVANMIVQTEETEKKLAQNDAQLGALTAREGSSERTLIRHGQKLRSDAAAEILEILAA